MIMMKYYNYEGFLTNISLLKCIVILYRLLHDLTLRICIVLDTRNEVDGDWVYRNWREQDGKISLLHRLNVCVSLILCT